MMRTRPIARTLVGGAGWVLLALVVGSLLVALTSSGWVGLVLGSGGLLAVVALVRRLADRGPLLRGRVFWSPLLLAGFAVLVASIRNTALGLLPVRWLALFLAAAAVLVSLVGLVAHRGKPGAWRSRGLVIVTVLVLVGVLVDGFGAYRTEEVLAANGEVHLSGRLLVPRGEGPFPAVLFIHGSGAEPGFVSRSMADRMAREGMAALTWDKRGTGRSVGGSPRDDYEDLASDVIAWIGALSSRPDIDGDQIALWGWSEGAWVAPLAAEQLGDVAALVLVSPGVEFGETYYYELGWRIRNAGFSEAEAEEAINLRRDINAYYRTGAGRSELFARLATVQDEAWYRAGVEVGLLPAALDDVIAPDDPETVAFIERQDFTLLTSLAEFEGPVLAAFGLQDQCNPPETGADTVENALRSAGNDHRILRYPEAGHVLLVWLTGERSCGLGIPPFSYPVGFVDEAASWLTQSLER